jgi:hypothetical protein
MGARGGRGLGIFLDIGGIEGVWFEDERLCGQQSYDNFNKMSFFHFMKETICVRIKETIKPQSFLNDKFHFNSFVFHWPMGAQNEHAVQLLLLLLIWCSLVFGPMKYKNALQDPHQPSNSLL